VNARVTTRGAEDVGAAHEALVAALKEVNLECHPDKCYVWSPSGEYGELPHVLTVSEEAGMIILGVPIGTYAPEEMVTCVETLDPASKYTGRWTLPASSSFETRGTVCQALRTATHLGRTRRTSGGGKTPDKALPDTIL
jgi:hypothetical protein